MPTRRGGPPNCQDRLWPHSGQLELPPEPQKGRHRPGGHFPFAWQHYRRLAGRLREARPDLALSSDFIVGFPGESESDFQATLDLVRGLGLANTVTDDAARRVRILDRWADTLDTTLTRRTR